MDWSRAKKIIIGMLLLVNLFLLGTLVYLKYDDLADFREAAQGTVRVLAGRGIELDESLITNAQDSRRLSVIVRSREREAQVAESLLGTCEVSSSGGNDRYRSASGSAAWLSGGSFDAQLVTTPSSLASALTQAGVLSGGTLEDSGEILQTYDGQPIFNCQLRYSFSGDECIISGRCCLGETEPMDTEEPMGLCGILIEYASIVQSLAIERIDAIDSGWVAQTLPGIGVRLIPVWRITASDVVTYVNALDGSAVLAEG